MTAERGLERLHREDGARLWRALVSFSGDREVASDAVAEAFSQALGRGEDLRDPRRWVWRAAFRIAAGELKDRRRFRVPAFDPGYEMEEPPGRLVAGLARISPNQRAALVRRYSLGTAALDLGTAYLSANPIRSRAVHVVEALAARTGATALVCSLVGAEVLVIVSAEGDTPIKAAATLGERMPVHATAAGKAIADPPIRVKDVL